MAINPMKMLEAQRIWKEFTERHPKFPQFMSAVKQEGITEGTVLEVQITYPDGRKLESNLKVSREDLDALNSLQDMK